MSRKGYDQLRSAIRGPVFPVVVPFAEDQSVDLDKLGRYVSYLVEQGAPVILVTVGTSRFNLLTREEMKAVNQTVAEASGDAIVIVAGPGPVTGSTQENIEFAKHAEKVGADGILLLYPERWYGDRSVCEFFREIAQNVDIGIMVHTMPLRNGYKGVTSLKYLTADILEEIVSEDNLVGVKEESGDRSVFEEILDRLKDKVPIIGAGGAMRRFIGDHKIGSVTYLVGIGSIRPKLALEFYQSVVSGDEGKAESIAAKYEDPYFQMAAELGWHPALKESLGLSGLMPPFERDPMKRISVEKRQQLSALMRELDWLAE